MTPKREKQVICWIWLVTTAVGLSILYVVAR